MQKLRVLLICAGLPALAAADEGMWTIDNFPADRVQQDLGVTINDEWLRGAQLSTVRLENGCTGSFSSEDGLILTNNHCVWGCIRNLSSAESNLSDDGFHAKTRGEELQCPGQQVSVLVNFSDVTKDVTDAMAGLDEGAANDARKATLTQLESDCEEKSGNTCEAVALYNGGQQFIYEYKRYDDVRLVFAPELDIGAFGGDPDNFNFPRWSFDMSFLRAYEDGKPAETPNFLKWRKGGPDAGEAVFISGHPGSTDRQLTMSQLRMLRDVEYPNWLYRYSELRGRMLNWAKTGDEAAREVQQRILGIENGLKVRRNDLKALQNDAMMGEKARQEAELRDIVAADEELNQKYGEAWDLIDGAMAEYRNFYEDYLFIESGAGFGATLFDYARELVRGTTEREKPNTERIRTYSDAALPQLEAYLFAATPISKEYEILRLEFSLEKMREWLGPDSPYVHKILGNESPADLAAQLVNETQLHDPDFRRELWEGGAEAIAASDDPLIVLARTIDPDARALRKRHEESVEAPLTRGSKMIADARFAVYGTDIYPDATFTLRITFGEVLGWEEKGELIEPFTQTRRLFERTTGKRPFKLPATWVDAREAVDPDTHFNFVATTDITGGNSGSPIMAADGSIVGLAFDGNIHSIAGSYWFDASINRTVGVATPIMLEALDVVYDAQGLLDELTVVE